MTNKTYLPYVGIAAFFAAGLVITSDLIINPPLLGVAIAFVSAGLLLAFAASEESKRTN